MDAHLFRRFCDAAIPRITGARLEKLQAPAPNLFTAVLFGRGGKSQLCLRFGRSPFIFLHSPPLAAAAPPPAWVMRLRKFAGGRRVAACVPQFWSRRLHLLLAGPPSPQTTWLTLDLARGPALAVLPAGEEPVPEEAVWPEPATFPDRGSGAARISPGPVRPGAEEEGGGWLQACAHWRDWPVLTPALRRTLREISLPEGCALMSDLRAGGGDVFLYPGAASAWPLPPALRRNRPEKSGGDVLALLDLAGQDIVLDALERERERALARPRLQRKKKLLAVLAKMREDEARLARMCAARADALALQANLWRWPGQTRRASVILPLREASGAAECGEGGIANAPEGLAESGAPGRILSLDGRLTVSENMQRLFHQARRGQRGLAHLARRRAALRAELAAMNEILLAEPAGVGTEKPPAGSPSPSAGEDAPPERSRRPDGLPGAPLPKKVALFISSDGFALLRGRDARGNLEVRKLARPWDIWLHVTDGPGSHVVIRLPRAGAAVPERTLLEAGGLAANKSWQQNAALARVQYAEARHVKPMRKAAPGAMRLDKILFTREVEPDLKLEERLAPSGKGGAGFS